MNEPLQSQAPQPPKKKRSGSAKRQRQRIISAFLRTLGTGQPRSRERRRPLPELKPFTAALGRLAIYASNQHHLLKMANRGDFVFSEEVAEASKKLNEVADELMKIIRGGV